MFTEIDAADVAMIMDADSITVPEFLETALGRLAADPDLIAVGGVFYGEEGGGLVGQSQRNEYTRYQRYISRRLGKVFVLGLTRATLRYWLQQIGIGYGTIALNAYLLLMLITLLAADSFVLVWFWVAIGLIFVVERVTVWAAGWRGRALALPLVIEIGYDLILQAVYVKSLFDIATGRQVGWNYVPREALPQ
jgi:hypothetical protein